MHPVFFYLSFILILKTGIAHDAMNNQTEEKKLKYLALGDSYTIGEGVGEEERYPVLLSESLKGFDIHLSEIKIIARTGWTTDELSEAIDKAELSKPWELVTLLIGVNNQYRGRSPESYRSEFVALLERSIDFAGGRKDRVIVLSIPDWGVTPFAEGRDREKIASETDAYNGINREESERAGVSWLDVTTISREAALKPELLAADGLHPSGLMYRYWVKDLLPLAFRILNKTNQESE